MSTRSGKRLHSSFHDNLIKSDLEDVTKSEKKPECKLLKENIKKTATVFKSKKRNNYVSYPTDDEQGTDRDEVDNKEEGLMIRTLRRNTLKERNTIHISSETVHTEDRKSTRTTRRTRKFPEIEPQETDISKTEAPKLKKTKKKKSDSHEEDVSKKTKKKKGKKRSTSIIVEDIDPIVQNHMNKSNASIHSFYSAAGSPKKVLKDIQTIPSTQVDTCQSVPTEMKPIIEGRQTRSGKQPNNITQTEKVSRKRKSNGITNDITYVNTDETHNKRHKSSVNINQDFVDGESTTILKSHLTSNQNAVSTTLKEKEMDKTDFKFNEMVEKDFDLNLSKMSNRRSTRKSNINETCEKLDIISQTENITNKSIEVNVTFDKDNGRESVKDTTFDKNSTFDKDPDSFDKRQSIKSSTFNKDTTFEQENENVDMNSIKNTTFDKTDTFEKDSNHTFDKRQSIKNSTFNKDATFEKYSNTTSDKRKSIKDSTFDKNTTYEKDSNSTFDKSKSLRNTIFDKSLVKDNTFEKGKSFIDTTFDKESVKNTEIEIIRDSTFDKKTKDIEVKDLTFEKYPSPIQNVRKSIINIENESITLENKPQDSKLNTTFEKVSKLSLLSSDNSNMTSDISRISITSDDSKDNIVNTTPVLIESSIDESLITNTLQSPDSTTKTPQAVTPLKREGTFTKDEPAISSEILSKTPTKQLSLPSPGSTPFPNKISRDKDKTLNLTHSIEKRRSSLADVLPRATKVMFCSPVNNPAVVIQQKRKVIKSNLKGSNKSFVFEENCIEPRAGARRKRSYTQSDADDASCKRKRFADDVQQSIDRLARPRTSSANAKLSEPSTPSKKWTPSKPKIARTKLPNFAALHQKQFDKMESLDECQERRARRAKQLLTPTGAVTVLERTSPKEAEQKPKEPELKSKQPDSKSKEPELKSKQPDSKSKEPELKSKQTDSKLKEPELQSKQLDSKSKEPELKWKQPDSKLKEPELKPKNPDSKSKGLETKPKEANSKPKESETKRRQSESKLKEFETKVKESETKPKKPETPIKSLPTLKSLNPGYSRFGFRLNFDVNPFESSKTDVKPKDKRPAFTRQATLPGFTREPTLPSLTGATSTRREEAKRAVMREKSFTDKRNINRKENRTIIKGVRTNRRFELQMRMRNIE